LFWSCIIARTRGEVCWLSDARKPLCEEEEEEAVSIIYDSCIEYMGRMQRGAEFPLSRPTIVGADERRFKYNLKFHKE
jgi:hypothetical protein